MRTAMALAALAAVGAAPAIAQQATPPQVRIDTGALRGASADGVVSFKGIPFAAPPVGPLRWRAPQPAASWSGIRDATRYGHDCMQLPFPSDAAPLGTPPAEDCLYANVWKPAGAKAKLPVMVWIYGGGFVNGGSSPPTYSGAELARQGIMVVSFNYRLGRFGAFAHPQLTRARADGPYLGNYGYLDQVAALRWVRRNIAAFGGDPANVTIIGESAGGMSIHNLLTSPLLMKEAKASPLFQKAVIQSGGPGTSPGPSLADAEAIGVAFATSKGIAADDPQALAKLRALPAEAVVDGLNLAAMTPPPGAPRTYSGPIVDGLITTDPAAAYANGRFQHVPVMLGATSADIGGPDGYMIAGARSTAAQLSAQGVPTYYYRFSYVATSARTPDSKGAGHATDIPFFFDTAAIKYGDATSATDRAAGTTASHFLVQFVRTGKPAAQGLPAWPAYAVTQSQMMDLDAQGGAHLVRDPAS